MKIIQAQWPIRRLIDERNSINLSPWWQRGPAWKSQRQVLLIDSILRGMDIPKVYLRDLDESAAYRFDAVDGQQRLRAIWQFHADELRLDYPEPLPPVEGRPIASLTFSGLHKTLRSAFLEFSISVAQIMKADRDEITNLFSRLQMGVPLNPAELRNAIQGPLRNLIDTMAGSHQFFQTCRIPGGRYKHQDYVAHLFAIAAHHAERDIKARDLRNMIIEFGPSERDRLLDMAAKVGDALTVLEQVNELVRSKLTQKWIVVDLGWLVMQALEEGRAIDPTALAQAYQEFDSRRKDFASHPEALLQRTPNVEHPDIQLYNYITRFRTQGGLRSSLDIRNKALRSLIYPKMMWRIDGV